MKSDLLVMVLTVDPDLRSLAQSALEGKGCRACSTSSYEHALALMERGTIPDLLLIEPRNLSGTSYHLFHEPLFRNRCGDVCLILNPGEEDLARKARAVGITRFLTLPVMRQDIESLLRTIEPGHRDTTGQDFQETEEQRLFEHQAARMTPQPRKPIIEELGAQRFFLAASPSMLEIHRQVKLLAAVDATVLILGESGTGKEIVAHLIHKYSKRSRQPFLNFNCAALPMDLLESELFGYVKGAFTGAIGDKPGRFELADRGTLLLDEIGEMNCNMQAKLLHVLQDGQFSRLGSRQTTTVDVRILAATNIEMESALAEKRFREDLYYRLNTFTVSVPPLRERRIEIPYLINEMIQRTPINMRPPGFKGLSSRVMDIVQIYKWPGNIRELRNFMTRIMIMQDEGEAARELETKISNSEKPRGPFDHPQQSHGAAGMRTVIRDARHHAEAQMIQSALDTSGWNRRRAAQRLEISYRALLYKIQQYRLSPDSREPLGATLSGKAGI